MAKSIEDCEFVKEPSDSQQCPICINVLFEPNLLSCCGHHLCRTCVERIQRDNKPCPLCQQSFTSLLNKGKQREINELIVRCKNSGLGCGWEGELGNLNRHRDGCHYEQVPCSRKCGVLVQRRSIQQHENEECPLRPFQCEYCHRYTSTYNEVVNEHQPRCDFFPVFCPNSCGIGGIPRHSLEDHLKECPLEVVDCEYRSIGCSFRRPRKDISAHMNVQQQYHNKLVLRHSVELQRKLEEQDERTRSVPEQLQNLLACFQSMQEERSTQATQLSQLVKVIEESKVKMESLEAENQALRGEVSELKQMHEEQKEASQNEFSKLKQMYEEQKEASQNELKQMHEEQRETSQKEIEALQQESATLKEQQEQQEKKIAKEAEALKQNTQALKEQVAQLEQQLQKLSEEATQLREQQEEGTRTTETLRTELTKQREAGKKQLEKVSEEIEATVKAQRQDVIRLGQRQAQQERQITELSNKQDGSQKGLEAVRKDIQAQTAQLRESGQKTGQEIQQTREHQERALANVKESVIADLTVKMDQLQRQQDQAIQKVQQDVQYVEDTVTLKPQVHFTMSRFQQHRKNEEPFYSPSFYSAKRGYKMYIRVDANGSGDGRGSHVSVLCCLQRGEHDNSLAWPFRAEVHIRLLNMKGDSNHIDAVIKYDDDTSDNCAKQVLTGDKNYLHTSPKAVKLISHQMLFNPRAGQQYLEGGALDFVITRVAV